MAVNNPCGINPEPIYYIGPDVSMRDPNPSLGKIAVRVVELVEGHVGQILVDGKPVWESAPFSESSDAADEATEQVQAGFTALFASLFA